MKENERTSWNVCPSCQGSGKKRRRIRKKVRLQYQRELAQFKKNKENLNEPVKPRGYLEVCSICSASGLIQADSPTKADHKNYPQVAIIGGGIAGTALAVACLHRGIPFTLFERDANFKDRSQGYGLTLQQASKAINGFGISSLAAGVVSTRHVVHNTEGKVVAEWGMRKWIQGSKKQSPKKTNIHIARQTLRLDLMNQLEPFAPIKWGHQLVDFKQGKTADDTIKLSFKVNGTIKNYTADLVVGADGIRSSARKLLIGDKITPLRYLDCIVILGICPLNALRGVDDSLLDAATVFQTANGHERIYVMPFNTESVMWQLSFPLSEKEAKTLSSKGAGALKKEAAKRTQWHEPIPQIIAATAEKEISGYPVYDRELLKPEMLAQGNQITLIGDAAHPMSPFKGQGANQALIDALFLAREIYSHCGPYSNWKTEGIRKSVLRKFETEMLDRSSIKVQDSAEASQFLHSENVLDENNAPRGKQHKKE